MKALLVLVLLSAGCAGSLPDPSDALDDTLNSVESVIDDLRPLADLCAQSVPVCGDARRELARAKELVPLVREGSALLSDLIALVNSAAEKLTAARDAQSSAPAQ